MHATATLNPTTTTQPGVSGHEYDLMLTAATTTAQRLSPAVESNALAQELATLCQPFEATTTQAAGYSKCDSGAHWAV